MQVSRVVAIPEKRCLLNVASLSKAAGGGGQSPANEARVFLKSPYSAAGVDHLFADPTKTPKQSLAIIDSPIKSLRHKPKRRTKTTIDRLTLDTGLRLPWLYLSAFPPFPVPAVDISDHNLDLSSIRRLCTQVWIPLTTFSNISYIYHGSRQTNSKDHSSLPRSEEGAERQLPQWHSWRRQEHV